MRRMVTDVIERIRSLVDRDREAREMAEEMRFHLEQEIRRNVADGMSEREARRAAHRAFGGVERWTEDWRESRGVAPLERLARDVRLAARRLRREPSLSLPALATLALGIGATTAVYALVHATLIRPLPYPEPDRLVELAHATPALGAATAGQSTGTYAYYRARAESFEEIALYFENAHGVSVTDGEAPERLRAAMVSPSFFPTLGVPPAVGRWFTEDEGFWEPGDPPTPILISHDLWVRRYGADPALVGGAIELNQGAPRTVLGVMPAGFDFPHPDTDVWYVMQETPATAGVNDLVRTGLARLRPGVSIEDARAELARLVPGLAEVYPDVGPDVAARLEPTVTRLHDRIVSDVRRPLELLALSALFVLVVTLANVAGLFLVRAERRRREIAVARALGAGRRDLSRRFLSEGLLLAAAGGLLGAAAAGVAVDARFGLGPTELPRLQELDFGLATIAFAVAVSVTVGLLTASLSLLRARESLGGGGVARGRSLGGRGWSRVHRSLAGLQVALSLVLLVTSGTMGRSLRHALAVDPGFATQERITFHIQTPGSGYPGYVEAAGLYRRVRDEMLALPEVSDVEATWRLPLTPAAEYMREHVEGEGPAWTGQTPRAEVSLVTPGYFASMAIPLLGGDAFGDLRTPSELPPVVVSAGLARALYGGIDVVGRTLRLPGRPARYPAYTIAGVVGDVPGERLTETFDRTLYVPVLLDAGVDPAVYSGYGYVPTDLTLVLRVGSAGTGVVRTAREIVRAIDPKVPITAVGTLDDLLADATARMRLVALLSAIAAIAALGLGVAGVYGIVAYSVSRRTAEIGLRMALGSTGPEVERLVLGQTARIAAVGIVGGLLAARALADGLRAHLFEVSPTDPTTWAVSTVVVAGVVLGAGWLPARRAGRLDVVDALRTE